MPAVVSRRGFLGTMLASISALTLDPAKLLWLPPEGEASVALPALAPEAITDLRAITQALCVELSQLWQGSELVDSARIGQSSLRHQFSVTMETPSEVDRYGLDGERYILPTAKALANRMREARATRCGVLELPTHGAEGCTVRNPHIGLAVRGIQQYALDWDLNMLRFDVVCG